jgi:hypothetical protein
MWRQPACLVSLLRVLSAALMSVLVPTLAALTLR